MSSLREMPQNKITQSNNDNVNEALIWETGP